MASDQVRFPRLARIPPLGRGEELAVPRWMGALARDPATLLAGPDGKGRRFEWAYPGTLSLQVMALYRRGRGRARPPSPPRPPPGPPQNVPPLGGFGRGRRAPPGLPPPEPPAPPRDGAPPP